MGLLSTLGSIGKGLAKKAGKIGAVAAAPFTGGASLAALPLLEKLGGVLGGGASASAAGRRGDAGLQAQMNQANNAALLNAGQFNLEAPGRRASQVARGDVLSSMQDSPLLGDARIDKFAGGGLRPSAFGASSRQAGDELKRQALMAMLSGSDRITPQISQLPKSGILEKLGGVAGLVGGIAGAVNESRGGNGGIRPPEPQVLDIQTAMAGLGPPQGVPGLPTSPIAPAQSYIDSTGLRNKGDATYEDYLASKADFKRRQLGID